VPGPDAFRLLCLFFPALLAFHVRHDLGQELLRVIAELNGTHVGRDRTERSSKRLEAVDDLEVMISDELTQWHIAPHSGEGPKLQGLLFRRREIAWRAAVSMIGCGAFTPLVLGIMGSRRCPTITIRSLPTFSAVRRARHWLFDP
jgi:hypothetical protein